jgi:hypothetical protein
MTMNEAEKLAAEELAVRANVLAEKARALSGQELTLPQDILDTLARLEALLDGADVKIAAGAEADRIYHEESAQ